MVIFATAPRFSNKVNLPSWTINFPFLQVNALDASEREVEHPKPRVASASQRCSFYRSDPFMGSAAVARTKYIRRSTKKVKQRGLGRRTSLRPAGIESQSISLNVFDPMGTYYAPNVEFVIIITVTRLTIQAPAASF
jgi:hypothetical protein